MSGVFCLYIRVKLKTDAIPEFLERWGKLASHVRANEPETLSYELCRSDQNEDEFMIVERYPSRAQLEDPHQTSEEFKAFSGPRAGWCWRRAGCLAWRLAWGTCQSERKTGDEADRRTRRYVI